MNRPGRSRKRLRVARWSALAAGTAAVLLVTVLATRQPASLALAESPLVGRPAPATSGTSFAGRHVGLGTLRGRFVLVNFYAPWCQQCQQEEPQLEAFLFTHPAGARTAVLGVLYGDTEADGKAFQSQNGATWPSILDPGGIIASRWGVGSLPRSFLVNPAGRVVDAIVGAVTASQLDNLVLAQLHR